MEVRLQESHRFEQVRWQTLSPGKIVKTECGHLAVVSGQQGSAMDLVALGDPYTWSFAHEKLVTQLSPGDTLVIEE